MTTKRVYTLQRYGNLFWLKAVVMGEAREPRVVRLLVDTGSSYTVLPPSVLTEIGCDVSASNRQVAIMAAGGMVQPRACFKSLVYQRFSFEDPPNLP
jgi:Aspartyl protease